MSRCSLAIARVQTGKPGGSVFASSLNRGWYVSIAKDAKDVSGRKARTGDLFSFSLAQAGASSPSKNEAPRFIEDSDA